MPRPLVLISAVGLTTRLLPMAPMLAARAAQGWSRPMIEPLPAVTCTAQATILTGQPPSIHGIVGNGWFFSETGEVRFWQQSHALIQAPTLPTLLKRANPALKTANMFWWFNQGGAFDYSVTPKPYYGADGSKFFAIDGYPRSLPVTLEQELGPFPFSSFWGPRAGLPSTEWIARASARVLRDEKPDLLLVYLPHLDYQPQRTGPSGCDMKTLVGELDRACQPLLEAIDATGAATWVVGEYGHTDASQPIYINQSLRRAGWLETRDGPYGEGLDTFGSRAFAVCDHQIAHVRVRDAADVPALVKHLSQLDGVAEVLAGPDRGRVGLDHPRSGEVIAFSRTNAWFAYPYWLESKRAPDFARTVDIHRKPGYDPCELFVDPAIAFPMVKVARKLMARKLGFRALIDVIPLDASLVKGSHGLRATTDAERPVLIGSGPAPAKGAVDATAVLPMLLGHWGLGK